MSSPTVAAISDLLSNGPHRLEVGRKQLTIALGGLYIASTTEAAKPSLVWESEKGYPRYYIPIQSLHEDIKAQLAEHHDHTNPGSQVSLSPGEIVNGNGNESKAVIENLTVGSRTIPWVRFVEGPLKGFIRFERTDIDAWFENGALSTAIKNPYKRIDTHAVSHDIVIKVDGEKVAESKVAVLLNETGLKEAYYLPATSILGWGTVEKSELRTACPYKGEASYLSINVKGRRYENLIWYYPYPTHESSAVEGLISFYNKDGVDILLDGVKV